MSTPIEELTALVDALRAETIEQSITPERIGAILQRMIDVLPSVSDANSLKGWVAISSINELPSNPSPTQRALAYLLDTTLYVYVGSGGDTLEGKYRSAELKGDVGAPGRDGYDLGLAEIVDNLESDSPNKVLSAGQGKRLKEMIDSKTFDVVDDMDVVYPQLLKRLPSGYTALDYIDNGSAGSGAVLDTGIVPNADDYRFIGSWRRTGNASSSKAVISAVSSTAYGQYKIIRNGSNNDSLTVCAYNKSLNATTVTLADSGTTAWHNYDLRVGKIVLDGVETALNTTTTGQLASSVLLGDVNYPQQIGRFLVFKGEVLVAAFQPCKNASDVYGMYDLVGEQFYGSSNANAFSGGNEAMMPADKVVSGSSLMTALAGKGNEITKSLIGGTEILPADSRLNADTAIANNTAGGWQRIHTTYNLERASDGVGLRINSSNNLAFGIKYPALLAGYSSAYRFCISFEARSLSASTIIPTIDIFLNEDYINCYDPNLRCTLTNEWERYVFTDVAMGNGDQGGQISINSAKHIGAGGAFEIRNFSIMLANPVTLLDNRVDAIELDVADNILRGKKVSIMGDSISTYEGHNAVEFTVLASDITNNRTLQGYPTMHDVGKTIGNITVTEDMIGVLTDFTPVSGDEGKTIGEALNRNTQGDYHTGYELNDIWWWQLAAATGATILQNVSWSGSSMCSHEDNIVGLRGLKISYAWHDGQINKLATRDADGNTINPDVVIIYRGTNDMSHTPYAKLTDFGAGSVSIPDNDTVTGGYGFKEAYALTIKKIRAKYPNALVICCTLNVFKRVNCAAFPTNNGTNTLPEFNNAIREIADMMGCGLIEFDKDGVTFENCYPTYIDDNPDIPTHPNPRGHRMMAQKAIADVMKM